LTTRVVRSGKPVLVVPRYARYTDRSSVSRTDGGVLNTLTGGPRRITELAELEGLAQPTMTLIVQRLEQVRA
jgi:hypothetical protein